MTYDPEKTYPEWGERYEHAWKLIPDFIAAFKAKNGRDPDPAADADRAALYAFDIKWEAQQ